MSTLHTNYTKRVFVIHSWNFSNSSLYPPIADGVEYLDGFIDILKKICEERSYDLRMDNSNFIPGKTVRENLNQEISNADFIFVFLDGLRPNVVYEMGFAFGLNFEKNSKKIICFNEMNATVLTRSFYPNPQNIQTVCGNIVKILNPPLDVTKHLSDNSDLLRMVYDRNKPKEFEKKIYELFDNYDESSEKNKDILNQMEESKTWNSDSEDSPEENKDTLSSESGEKNTDDKKNDEDIRKKLWNLYKDGKYSEIIRNDPATLPPFAKKTLAMSYMNMNMNIQAIEIFKILLKDKRIRSSASYFLGMCYFTLGKYHESLVSFLRAQVLNYKPQAENSSIDLFLELAAQKVDAQELANKSLFQTSSTCSNEDVLDQ